MLVFRPAITMLQKTVLHVYFYATYLDMYVFYKPKKTLVMEKGAY